MQESRAPRDISVSKQMPTQSKSVGPSIFDTIGAGHSCQLLIGEPARPESAYPPILSVNADIPAWRLSAKRRPEQVQQTEQAYSITSSAVASSVAGNSRPSALAVLRL